MNSPQFKNAFVQFKDSKYNYFTSVNGKQTDEQIIKYFKGQKINLGHISDNVQECIECTVSPCDFKS